MEKKITLFIFLVFFAIQHTNAQAPIDVGSVELLISRHKKQYDRLKERNADEAKHHSLTLIVKNISEKYEKLHKDLTSKYNLIDGWINLGIEAAGVIKELKDVGKALPPFLAQMNHIKNLTVLEKYYRAARELESEIRFCVNLSASIPALRLDAKELYDIALQIQDRLYRIRYIINKYTWLIKGQVTYNLFTSPSLPDRVKIATKIIKDFNNKQP